MNLSKWGKLIEECSSHYMKLDFEVGHPSLYQVIGEDIVAKFPKLADTGKCIYVMSFYLY